MVDALLEDSFPSRRSIGAIRLLAQRQQGSMGRVRVRGALDRIRNELGETQQAGGGDGAR